MIIDFHTHAFPEQIAASTLDKLAHSSRNRAWTDGTAKALSDSMRAAGIDCSVLLPVATKPSQCDTINRTALAVNEHTEETGLLSFGAIHPDCANYRQILRGLALEGARGIKVHPVFQGVYFDDIRYMRIFDCACEYGLAIVTHAGYDISFPGKDFATPKHILPVIRQLHPDKLVLAHTGGWGCWEEAEEILCGADVWFDTSFTTNRLRAPKGTTRTPEESSQLDLQSFVRIIRKHGVNHVLFGTDSPWSSQQQSLDSIRRCGLTDQELALICGKNACRLLGL